MLYEIFAYVLQNSAAVSLVIAVVLLVRALMCRMPKKYSYLLWAVVGIRLICPYAAVSPVSVFHITQLWSGDTVSTVFVESRTDDSDDSKGQSAAAAGPVSAVSETQLQQNQKIPANRRTSQNAVNAGKRILSDKSYAEWFSVVVRCGAPVWLAGMAALIFWNVYRLMRMKKRLCAAVRYQQDIYECDAVPAPFVMGLVHPKIYLPFRLDKHELTYIIEHERHHIRRRDYRIRPAAFLLACIYWFHPLVWLSYFLMNRDMEMSCDEYVLQHASVDVRRQYCRSLLAFAFNQRGMSAGPVAFGETETGKRVKHVLNLKRKKKWVAVLAAAVLIITGTACLTNATDKQPALEETGKADRKPVQKEKTKKKITKKELAESEEIKAAQPEEAVLAETVIHGFQVQVVYLVDSELPDKSDLESGMYHGDFEIRTCRNGRKYASHKLAFDFTDELYYPAGGFELAVKDYDRDGFEDDFAIGQGQMPVPESGNFMFYQFFAIEEDGSVLQHTLSTREQTGILTLPDEYSKDFAYVYGSISYPALGDNGTAEQTAHITTEYRTPDGEIIQSFSDDEIQNAIQTVKNYFKTDFKGCSLLDIWYSEPYQQTSSGYFKEQYQNDDVMMLMSEFYTEKSCRLSGFEKDSVYNGFNWILARNEKGEWEVRDYGY